MSVYFVMRLHNNVSLVYLLSPTCYTINFCIPSTQEVSWLLEWYICTVLKCDSQARYVKFSNQLPFSLSPKLWYKHPYRQIPRSFLSSTFSSPYHLPPLLFPLLPPKFFLIFHDPTFTRDYNTTHIVKQARYVILFTLSMNMAAFCWNYHVVDIHECKFCDEVT